MTEGRIKQPQHVANHGETSGHQYLHVTPRGHVTIGDFLHWRSDALWKIGHVTYSPLQGGRERREQFRDRFGVPVFDNVFKRLL